MTDHHECQCYVGTYDTTPTPRGFAALRLQVRNYAEDDARTFTVQESSLATERKVWIGREGDRAHMNEAEARAVRDALNQFLGEDDD